MASRPDVILDVQDLHVRFPVFGGVIPRKKAEVRAVDGVSLALRRGETIGLVGESGCGKTTVGRAIVNILRAMNYRVEVAGRILYHRPEGTVDLAALSRRGMRRYRSDLQMVFQDPYSSLNPRMTVGAIVEEPLTIHTRQSRAARRDKVHWLLEKVRLSPEHASRYPHEFSGGQRQRVGIARALATNPKIVIADEPVSALDVSIQAQVINLMQDLQEEFGLSYVFISHDLSVVRHISSRIFVMYLGNIVEAGPAEGVYKRPMHPYSRMLLSAVPRPDPAARRVRAVRLRDDLPSPLNKPSGCAFRTRCPIARPECAEATPPLEERNGRLVACPYVD
jgi:oligopeptide/dipeptide ABC transporter ATP-binding protein